MKTIFSYVLLGIVFLGSCLVSGIFYKSDTTTFNTETSVTVYDGEIKDLKESILNAAIEAESINELNRKKIEETKIIYKELTPSNP